jgi:hypothetical protein
MMVECLDANNLDAPSLWQWDAWLEGGDMPPPVICGFDDRCFFAGPSGRPVVLDLTNGEELFADIEIDGEIVTSPVSGRQMVFFATDGAKLYALDLINGVISRIDLPEGWIPSPGPSIAYGQDHVFCIAKGGMLVAIRAFEEG